MIFSVLSNPSFIQYCDRLRGVAAGLGRRGANILSIYILYIYLSYLSIYLSRLGGVAAGLGRGGANRSNQESIGLIFIKMMF